MLVLSVFQSINNNHMMNEYVTHLDDPLRHVVSNQSRIFRADRLDRWRWWLLDCQRRGWPIGGERMSCDDDERLPERAVESRRL